MMIFLFLLLAGSSIHGTAAAATTDAEKQCINSAAFDDIYEALLMMGPDKFPEGTVAGDNFMSLLADVELGGKCRQLRVALKAGEAMFEDLVTRFVDTDDGTYLTKGKIEFVRAFADLPGNSDRDVFKDNALQAVQMSVRWIVLASPVQS